MMPHGALSTWSRLLIPILCAQSAAHGCITSMRTHLDGGQTRAHDARNLRERQAIDPVQHDHPALIGWQSGHGDAQLPAGIQGVRLRSIEPKVVEGVRFDRPLHVPLEPPKVFALQVDRDGEQPRPQQRV